MFIVVKKVHSRRVIAGAAIAALAITLAGTGAVLTASRPALSQSVGAVQVDGRGIRTNEDRVAYLTRWGWNVKPEPASIEDILIPETFDSSYDAYLALQQEQGFDLTPYAGKTVKRYTYQVTNYPGLQDNIWAVLLLYHKSVIAGEVYCSSGDGFQQGLAFPGNNTR